MNANTLADELDDIDAYEKHQTLLGKASEMLRQQQAEIEALKANRKHDFGLGEASGFIKGHKENPYKAITNTKIEPTVVSYTHPYKPSKSEVDALLDNADYVVPWYIRFSPLCLIRLWKLIWRRSSGYRLTLLLQ